MSQFIVTVTFQDSFNFKRKGENHYLFLSLSTEYFNSNVYVIDQEVNKCERLAHQRTVITTSIVYITLGWFMESIKKVIVRFKLLIKFCERKVCFEFASHNLNFIPLWIIIIIFLGSAMGEKCNHKSHNSAFASLYFKILTFLIPIESLSHNSKLKSCNSEFTA